MPTLVGYLFANVNLALFLFCAWSYGTHVPVVLAVRGWRRPNRPTVWTIFRLCTVLGLNTHFGACSGFKHTEVRFGEPEPTSLKEENGRRPIFFIFWPIEVP
jgi:hypothetical protein